MRRRVSTKEYDAELVAEDTEDGCVIKGTIKKLPSGTIVFPMTTLTSSFKSSEDTLKMAFNTTFYPEAKQHPDFSDFEAVVNRLAGMLEVG